MRHRCVSRSTPARRSSISKSSEHQSAGGSSQTCRRLPLLLHVLDRRSLFRVFLLALPHNTQAIVDGGALRSRLRPARQFNPAELPRQAKSLPSSPPLPHAASRTIKAASGRRSLVRGAFGTVSLTR